MTIGLYGIYGVYNFGCEAIIRGACQLIHAIYPGANIVYYSYSYEYDKNVLRDLKLEIKPVAVKRSSVGRAMNLLARYIGSEKHILHFDYQQIIKEVDLLFSIGGDIYTIPKVLREKKKYPYYNSLVDFCDRAIEAGKQVVVYGASVGPFGNYIKAVDYYKRNLKKYQMIICREQESIDYLQSIGLNNTCFFPDPAFQVRSNYDERFEPSYIGINLSPLSLREIYGSYQEEYCKKLAGLLDLLYESTHKDLLFIPHVLSPEAGDNDLTFLQHLQSLMKAENQSHIQFADCEHGFLGLKSALKACYLVASARMHCAINAIDENIPAIFLSYSQKSVGMCKFVYGDTQWLVDLKTVETDLIPKVKKMMSEREHLVRYLKAKNDEINAYYQGNLLRLRNVLTGGHTGGSI